MNQILQIKDNYKNNTKHPKSKKDIVKLLLVILIVFCISMGIFTLIQKIVNKEIQFPTFNDTPKSTTTIDLTILDGKQVAINAQSDVGISKMTYDVNSNSSHYIEYQGEKFIETTIDVPVGENIIFVSILDVEGNETTKEQTVTIEAPKPEIDLSVVGNDIKITITSEVELSTVKYKWNDETEKKENMETYENKNLFEKKLEIPIGKNSLTIVAIDVNGGATEKVQTIKGVTKATATAQVEGEYLHFTVIGKEIIEKVEFVFNGKKYIMNQSTFGETKKVHYKVKLTPGTNSITITSTTQSGGTETTTYSCEYSGQ